MEEEGLRGRDKDQYWRKELKYWLQLMKHLQIPYILCNKDKHLERIVVILNCLSMCVIVPKLYSIV